ncbi:MAG: tetratricopeptide repeat protein [Planctomycetota bacterium]|nr:tetratricopeptide repeat protein [Planctomycetota bacterium]
MTDQAMTDHAMTEIIPDPIFDLVSDPIPSFGALQQERAKVYSRRSAHESFERTVEALADDGEPGRRKGLGFWMLARFEDSIQRLKSHEDDDVAAFTLGNALCSAKRHREAVRIFSNLSQKYPDEPRPRGAMLDAQLEADVREGVEDPGAALAASLAAAPAAFAMSAEAHYIQGRAAELNGDDQAAIESYVAARDVDPTHRRNLFALGFLAERNGLDELALEAYESLTSMVPADKAVLMNLGLLYEDLGRDQDAAACYDVVHQNFPYDRRARLYLDDAKAGMEMFYDEDMEKKEDRLNQILRIPITDFELSVRARNCLNKMDIMTLGDLVKKTEAELLSYKNFGETSLAEIKEILGSKSLRLGMAREEAVASIARTRPVDTTPLDPSDPRNRPLSELKLSIRARRTVENLGCLTLGDICAHSEDELLGMPNFGVTSLLELKNKLVDHQLTLKGGDKKK